jgi:hypothetical protein
MALLPEIIPPTQATTLADLIKEIRTAHQAVGRAASNMLGYAMAAGDALIGARRQVPQGGWESWLVRECDLAVRTAERYVQLAKARALFEGDPSRATGLSITGAIRLLGNKSRASVARPQRAAPAGAARPTTALDIVEAWHAAPLAERRRALDNTGLRALLDALPPSWLPSLVKWLVDLLETTSPQGCDAWFRSLWRRSKNARRSDAFARALRSLLRTVMPCGWGPSCPRPQSIALRSLQTLLMLEDGAAS